MTYVIAEPCIAVKDNSCVEVCPVDCIHPTPDEPDYNAVDQLYIDPNECIDCHACVEACPVDACFAETSFPANGSATRGSMRATTRTDLTAAALASLTGAALALVARISKPFDHGTWLVAYLFLVGFVAQSLLGLGQAALLSGAGWAPPPVRARLAQLVLWNIGVVAVPVGVLAEARVAVVFGSLSLIGALASLAQTTRPLVTGALGHKSWLGWGYAGLLAVMLASTLIGTALAWDIPWTP